MAGLERVVGYILAEQNLDIHLLCSGDATYCSERWVSKIFVCSNAFGIYFCQLTPC